MPARMSKDTIAMLIGMVAAGSGYAALCKASGFGHQTIYRMLAKRGGPLPTKICRGGGGRPAKDDGDDHDCRPRLRGEVWDPYARGMAKLAAMGMHP